MKLINIVFRIAFSSAMVFGFNHAMSASAATATVQVGDGAGGAVFVPAITNIAVNDTVTWSWNGVFHSSTSGANLTANGLWDSGVFSTPHSFSQTFTNAGTFPYFCSIHGSFGMTGAVQVGQASVPPTVTITNPAPGTVFVAPATVTIAAKVNNSGGSVTNVEFFDGGNLLGNATVSPYSVSVNLAAGSHTLTAVVFDNLGATNTSAPVSISVVSNTAPMVTLDTPTNGSSFIAPATITITASASSSSGSVTNVEFFDGGNLLGNATTNPYSISVNLPVGSHTLTALAFDNFGATNTSTPVTVSVLSSATPGVTLVVPTNGSVFTAPATIIIAAAITNFSSTVTNVEFFDNTSALGRVASSPFSILATLGVGAHDLSAVTTDDQGATNVSTQVTVTVTASNLPVTPPQFSSIVLSNKFPSPPLTVTNVPVITNGLITFRWSGDARAKFDLLYSNDLGQSNAWNLAQANIVADPSGTNVLSDPPYLASPAYAPNTNLFYRLRALPAQSPGLPLRLEVVASNLVSPTVLTHAHDGSGRLFIADQTGQIRIVDNTGNLLSEPFLDVSNRMVTLMPGYDERGLLGMAFHPGYSTNGRFFIYYVAPPPSTNFDSMTVLSEFKVRTDNPNLADTNSERVLLTINEPQFNHKGAAVVFGPDGYLYLGPGDGGGAGDQHGTNGNAQILSTLLGKMLRIDVDHGTPYAIPADNPFVNTPGALPEIYAYGLRNPWRFSFDRGGTHEGFIADVGQNLWEELDVLRKGANYGWRILEGNHAFEFTTASALKVDVKTLDYPIYEYGHGSSGISIIGGFVYRGTNYNALIGQYVFGDFSTSFTSPDGQLYYLSQTRPGIWERFSFQLWPNNARLGRFVKGFGEDEAGEIYLLSSTSLGPKGQTGDVRRLVQP